MMKLAKQFTNEKVADLALSLGKFLLKKQANDGSLLSKDDGTHDPWDHLEAVIGLIIAKEFDAAKLGLQWMISNQNTDGSWYNTYKKSRPVQKNKQSNHAAYLATASYYYYLATGDREYIEEIYPTIKNGFSFLRSMQASSGAFAWSIDEEGCLADDYLIAGNSSIFKSLECLFHLAKILKDKTTQEECIRLREGIQRAFRNVKDNFDLTIDRSRFSMDFYYPALCGVPFDKDLFFTSLNSFYVEGIGIKCVIEEPWVTVAESCECALALLKIGYADKAKKLLQEVYEISDQNNIPFMGWQYKEEIFWPEEQPTWTAGAMLILLDALFKLTGASNLFLDSITSEDKQ